MKKDRGEFVEVFRSLTDMDRPTAARGPGRSRKGSGGVRLNLSHEAIVIGGFVLICVVVAAYVVGYRRGRISGGVAVADRGGIDRTERVRPAGRSADLGVGGGNVQRLSIPASSERKVPFYTVRIIDGIRLDRARELREALRQQGYDAFVSRSGNAYAVNIGSYPRLNSPAAVAMKEKFVKMKYEGGRWFKTAYIRQITRERSLVK